MLLCVCINGKQGAHTSQLPVTSLTLLTRVERKMLSYVYIKLLHMLGFSLPVLNTIIVFITNVHFYKLRRKTC